MAFSDSYVGKLRSAVGNTPLILTGARVLVTNDAGAFLIMQRSDDGNWGLPGGAMELGESLIETAHREVFEETGVTIDNVTAFGLSSNPAVERHTYPNGDVAQFVVLLVHGVMAGGTPHPKDGEALHVAFRAESEIDKANFLDIDYQTFGHWRRYRQTGHFQIV